MAKAVRNPSQNIEDHALVSREDVADVGTVKDVLESR